MVEKEGQKNQEKVERENQESQESQENQENQESQKHLKEENKGDRNCNGTAPLKFEGQMGFSRD